MKRGEWIWVVRWSDFQHYTPERDRAPAWIKTYTKQLDDDRYLRLTLQQRAVLHDIRSAFARAHGRLTSEPRAVTQRIGRRVTSAQLDALSHAGFIELCSRKTLEQRLDQLYASRAPARSKEEELPSVVRNAREGLGTNGPDPRASEEDEPGRDPDALAKIRAMAERIGKTP